MSHTDHRGRTRFALALGALFGFLLAVAAILRQPEAGAVARDVVATVNGVPIAADALERAAGALSSDRRFPISELDRRQLLERLIDEELLVQRARELGLDRHDQGVRSRLVGAMLETVVAERSSEAPSDSDLAAYYRANVEFFTSGQRVWVRHLRVAITPARPESLAREIAAQAAARLRLGVAFADTERELGDAPIVSLPDGMLPIAKLRDYLGPTLVRRILELQPGDVSRPLRSGSAFYVVQMVERERGSAPPLEEIADEVRAEMRRRADDDAFRAYLDRLRGQATVWTRDP
jgi:peptidyl-prolyl cis-trans isomerase C